MKSKSRKQKLYICRNGAHFIAFRYAGNPHKRWPKTDIAGPFKDIVAAMMAANQQPEKIK